MMCALAATSNETVSVAADVLLPLSGLVGGGRGHPGLRAASAVHQSTTTEPPDHRGGAGYPGQGAGRGQW
jgi:hypothetical protein